ncbi:MAG TPA: hypothetical protein VFS99_01525 [Xanthomonadaceae bacterium]|nr:hypothetical protein [Xanthomonadaceae bacterium]
MIEGLALVVVVMAGLYFIALATVSLCLPSRASRFLLGFADSGTKHYAELLLRCVVGAALVLHAPRMLFSSGFAMFGWLLLLTTAALLLVPWRWHERFAKQAVPRALEYLTLIGIASFGMGALILAAVMVGSV